MKIAGHGLKIQRHETVSQHRIIVSFTGRCKCGWEQYGYFRKIVEANYKRHKESNGQLSNS